MLRSQILLSPELNSEIHKLSSKQNVSQSKIVRKLLTQALGLTDKQTPNDRLRDLSDFGEVNQRIDGFKEIYSVGGKTTEIKIVGDEVFRHYLANRTLPSEIEYQILKSGNELKEQSETKTLVVRRAYVVPGLENPPGPRFIGLKLEEVIKAITDIYDFAIENDYHVRKGSKIVVFLHPFADPKPLSLPIKMGVSLPYGGYAVPLNKEASRVEVFAVWGNNEGVQSLDQMDRYVIDATRLIILTKDIPQKNIMLCTTKKSQSEKLPVPPDKQFEQVLSDSEILEVARVVKKLTERYGLRRVEFLFDGVNGIIFNESAKYEIYEKKLDNIDKKGLIKVISSKKDVETIKKLDTKKADKLIIYINKKIVEDRAYDLLNNIASLANKFIVLYPSLSATAHAMRVLNDFGHTAVVVGNRVFKENEEVLVKIVDGQVSIEQLSGSNIKNYVINLYDAKLFGTDMVGGKANNLSLLKSKGFNVPHGWVITTNFFAKVSGKEHLGIWQEIEKSLHLEKNKRYAVRSSTSVEDHLDHSFAGQFDTFLNIKRECVGERVLAVIKNTYNKQVTTYVKAKGLNKPIKMAVIIQEMVDVDKAGVVFGKDLQTSDDDKVIIDVARGLGEGVVDGTAKTQRITYLKNKNQIINHQNDPEKLILDKIEITSLIGMAFSVEKMMGKIQDIEWAIDKQGTIWLVQSRDL